MPAYRELVEIWRVGCDECSVELLPPGHWSPADMTGAEVLHDSVHHTGFPFEGEDG